MKGLALALLSPPAGWLSEKLGVTPLISHRRTPVAHPDSSATEHLGLPASHVVRQCTESTFLAHGSHGHQGLLQSSGSQTALLVSCPNWEGGEGTSTQPSPTVQSTLTTASLTSQTCHWYQLILAADYWSSTGLRDKVGVVEVVGSGGGIFYHHDNKKNWGNFIFAFRSSTDNAPWLPPPPPHHMPLF